MSLSTLQKKQLVALTGLGLVGFVVAHLTGNFLIFKGADALNEYAKFLHDLGGILWAARIGLLAMFVVHLGLVANLVINKVKARGSRYAKFEGHAEKTSVAARLMPMSGVVILIYVIYHILDFTIGEKSGMLNGVDLSIYGLVVRSFMDPIHSAIYIVAMIFLGLHLTHSIQSVFQTFGIVPISKLPLLRKVSTVIGVGIAAAYSSIPIYVLINF